MTDEARAEQRREVVKAAREMIRIFFRIIDLFERTPSTSAISDALTAEGTPFTPERVELYLQFLKMRLGVSCGGRLYTKKVTA